MCFLSRRFSPRLRTAFAAVPGNAVKNWLARLRGSGAAPAPVALSAVRAQALADWQAAPPLDTRRSHYRTRYVVVDVEASGLDMKRDRLIAIGAVAVVNGRIDPADSFEVILRQEEVSTSDNILIHGIGGSAQREGTEPPDALLGFLHYCGHAPLVAYHALFDQTMIERAVREHLGVRLDACWIDLAWVLPDLFRERIDAQVMLDDWLALFDIDNIQRHNAVSDALATAMLLQAAMARATARGAKTPASFVDIEKARRWMRRSG
ncbi:3'-5' exonuclease [Rhodocyclus gracilis]|uniref:3'-5' exonuclease n=1 Tax=Rhodocyclus gracilis TaxID=2929842 RepID=UPI001ADB3EC3